MPLGVDNFRSLLDFYPTESLNDFQAASTFLNTENIPCA